MFAKQIKTAGIAALGFMISSCATAVDAPNWKSKGGTIPITVTLENVKSSEGPIYVSIQKPDEYMGMKGHGGILKTATPGTMQVVYKVDEPGDYSVSIWHDTNDDGIFSMDESYNILDGWGASGNAPTDRKPVFDDVKIQVESVGTSVTIPMKYPA